VPRKTPLAVSTTAIMLGVMRIRNESARKEAVSAMIGADSLRLRA